MTSLLLHECANNRLMIYQALNSISKELNEHLVRKFNLKVQQAAILNAILNQDGGIPEQSQNKIVITLINLEHETSIPFNPIYIKEVDEKTGETKKVKQVRNLPYNFNLDVLVTAVFESPTYDEGLKFLSEAIFFFQKKNVFTEENTPGLDPHIHELTFELVKLTYHEEHSLWGALGAKYMPSVLFKVRLLSFQSEQPHNTAFIKKIAPKKDHESITELNDNKQKD